MEYLVSAIEMSSLDRQTIEAYDIPGRVLMENAGRAVARKCDELLAGPSTVAVASGKGNNGGDGFVAARALAAMGHRVEVFVFGAIGALRGDAAVALSALAKTGEAAIHEVCDPRALLEFSDFLGSCALVVDALFGTGIRDERFGLIGDAIAVINDHTSLTVSVDMPSGVNADTGLVYGPAVQADHTVTFGFAKRGHYLHPGAALRGELTVADIGIPRTLADNLGVVARKVDGDDGPKLLRPRQGDCHKGNFGHVAVFAGSRATPGAALLCLAGALRSGVGLVSWATDAGVARSMNVPPEVMLRLRTEETVEEWVQRALVDATAVVVGPGLSTTPETLSEMRALVRASRVPLCIDADGLNLLAAESDVWDDIQAPVVITPHPREMGRLTGGTVAQVQRDRIASASQVAMARGCIVVLKGAGTVVADPDGTARVIAAGGPSLATGGTGDVLAGITGGFLAQGLDPSTAATVGALLHGVAGERAALLHGEAGTCASDVAAALGEVLVSWHR